MKPVHIEFVPETQKANQIADYGEVGTHVWFRITDFPGKPMYAVACLIHEIFEFYMNQELGVSVQSVDDFDEANKDHDDPGMLPDAPYHLSHCRADALERTAIALAGEDWAEYDSAVKELFND